MIEKKHPTGITHYTYEELSTYIKQISLNYNTTELRKPPGNYKQVIFKAWLY